MDIPEREAEKEMDCVKDDMERKGVNEMNERVKHILLTIKGWDKEVDDEYYVATFILATNSIVKLLMPYISVMQSFILIFAPALAAGMLRSQSEKLKMVLHDRLFQEREQIHSTDIEKFTRYIDARPFKFTVAKIIPLDWKLPLIILNITITYLIVIIQFAQLY
ncbi:uncharacterized protein LOC131842371 [Achroia grisella]|uniref:uncharacterized protein LOC131842371 n=1 Tax=Achroia grisella TaxID=688607 RepID=UPI0027D243DE|nr:uncharacterized protein LOC131842371 [Achroia grisella]